VASEEWRGVDGILRRGGKVSRVGVMDICIARFSFPI
jgi:hypothetical protein